MERDRKLMLQIRPTEIKAIANLLMQEHPDVDTLAEVIIQTIDELRAKRELYAIVAIHPSLQIVQVIGPYGTEAQARKDAPKRITKYDTQSRAYIGKMRDPSMIELQGTLA